MVKLDYKPEILLKLIEKYNKRDLKYSGKEINREISVKPGSSGVMVGENHPQPQYLC